MILTERTKHVIFCIQPATTSYDTTRVHFLMEINTHNKTRLSLASGEALFCDISRKSNIFMGILVLEATAYSLNWNVTMGFGMQKL